MKIEFGITTLAALIVVVIIGAYVYTGSVAYNYGDNDVGSRIANNENSDFKKNRLLKMQRDAYLLEIRKNAPSFYRYVVQLHKDGDIDGAINNFNKIKNTIYFHSFKRHGDMVRAIDEFKNQYNAIDEKIFYPMPPVWHFWILDKMALCSITYNYRSGSTDCEQLKPIIFNFNQN